jgi:hypothetical protein
MATVKLTLHVSSEEIPEVFARFRALVRALELPAYVIDVHTEEFDLQPKKECDQ